MAVSANHIYVMICRPIKSTLKLLVIWQTIIIVTLTPFARTQPLLLVTIGSRNISFIKNYLFTHLSGISSNFNFTQPNGRWANC